MNTPEALSNGSPVSTVSDGQLTAENLSLEVGDVSFVYRRFGKVGTSLRPNCEFGFHTDSLAAPYTTRV